MIFAASDNCRTCNGHALRMVVAVLALCGPPDAWALDGRKLTSQYLAREWSMEDGLPDNYIRTIYQSKEGYLWLGTQKNGVVRFDGVQFAMWPPEAVRANDEVAVRAFCQTKDGSLWVATDGAGLWRFKGREYHRYTQKDGLPSNHVRACHEDRHGTLWIAFAGQAIAQWNGARFALVAIPEDGPFSIADFLEDKQGRIWMAGAGLWHFKDGQFTNVRKKLDLPQSEFTSVCQSPDGSIWAGTMRGLVRLQGDRAVTYLEVDGLTDDQVRAVRVDRDGNLWIGTNSGLDRFREGKFTRCLTRELAPYDLVYGIFEDHEGNLWIGTNGGLTRLRDEKVSNLTTKEGLSQNVVAACVEARDSSLWVATWTRGVVRLKDGKATIYDKQVGLPRDSMTCIHADRHGIIWAGTQRGGLTRITDTSITTVGEHGALNGRRITALADDPEGHLWVLVEDGALLRFQGGTFNRVSPGEHLLGTNVQTIHSGVSGGFWAVTEAGLNQRFRAQWRGYPYPESIVDVSVRSAHEDGDGSVWLCVDGGGLVRFQNGRFTAYRSSHGLFDDNPHAVLEDHENNLWAGCASGLFRVDKADFARLDRGEIKALTCVSFNEADGMSSRQCMKVGFPLATKLRDGRLCFPTDRGIAVVDPTNLPRNPIVPPVALESIVLDYRYRFQPERLRVLPAATKDVEIHYAGMGLRAPERLHFKYRLEGYDEDWVDAGNRRTAHYQNLAPGNYRFQVIAANEDGVWNLQGAAFTFVKRPLLHQTAWFYGLCGLLLALGAGLVHWRRIQRAKKQFVVLLEERTRIARDLHDTLEQSLVGIDMQLNLAGAKFFQMAAAAHKHLEKARYMLRHSMADARSAILNLRSNGAPRKDLLSEIARIAEELSIADSMTLVTHAHGVPIGLPPFAEDTLVRIAQEAMTNVIKHARAKTIQVNLIYDADQLTLRVEDDGCGFDVAAANDRDAGYGLLGMRERTEKLGGELTISSVRGSGTLIKVVVPTAKLAV